MATVNSVKGRAHTPHLLPTLDRGDYFAAGGIGFVAAALAALRLGMWPLQHASLDPEVNRRFLFGILDYSAATLGNLPTVFLAGVAVALLTLQVTLLVKQPSSVR